MRETPMQLETVEFPVVDMAGFVAGSRSSAVYDQCRIGANVMLQYHIGIFRDPRFSSEGRNRFFRMMQRYFSQDREIIRRDVRRHPSKVLGVAMLGQEHARDHSAWAQRLPPQHRPYTTAEDRWRGDPKYRFHWRAIHPDVRRTMAGTPALAELLADQIVPVGFEDEWAEVMDDRSNSILTAIFDASRMVAIGLRLPEETFVDTMVNGTNVFGPTGCDVSLMEPYRVQAAVHYDFGQWTGHDAASHAGLIAWTKDGRPFRIVVPQGTYVIQAGKEAEILTGGAIRAGMHEVVTMPEAILQASVDMGAGRSTVRVAGPLFAQSGPGVVLSPRGRFDTPEARQAYPPTLSEVHQAAEIAANNL